jgi:hypothetical protein
MNTNFILHVCVCVCVCVFLNVNNIKILLDSPSV